MKAKNILGRHTCNLVGDLALFQPALFEFSLLRLKEPLIQMLLSCDPFLWIGPDLRQLWQKNWKRTFFFPKFVKSQLINFSSYDELETCVSKPNSERNVGGS